MYIVNIGTKNTAGLPLNKKPIKPDKKVEVKSAYIPKVKGRINDFLIIKSNAPENPETNIRIYGVAE